MKEAVGLLSQYDIHSDIDYAHHLASSHKQGFTTLGDETYRRYDTMKALLERSAVMNEGQITSAISRVAGRTTRWTAIFDSQEMEVTYYQNAEFTSPYVVSVVE